MDDLIEMIDIVSKKRLDKVDLLDEALISKDDTLFSKLYFAIKNKEISNDEDAIYYLYGEMSKNTRNSFRSLKSRLKTRIHNTLYFLDFNQENTTSSYQKTIYEQYKNVQTIHILRRNGATHTAVNIIKNNIKIAVNFHLYDVAKFYALELAKFYAMSGKIKHYHHYRSLFNEYSNKDAAIQNVTMIYYQLQFYIHYTNEKSGLPQKKKTILELLSELKVYRDQAYSFDTEYFYLRSKLFTYEYFGYLENIEDVCHEIDLLGNQKKFKQSVWRGVAALYFAKAKLSLKEYDVGIFNLKDKISLFVEGGLNWFTAKEYLLKLYMHNLRLEESKSLLDSIRNHASFPSLPNQFKEKLYIYSDYIQLASNSIFEEIPYKKIKIQKLYNSTPFYVNDKSGFYLSIRFIDIIECIRMKKYDELYERVEVINRYKYQFLNLENTKREKWFIQMLSSIIRYRYNGVKIQQKNQELYERLQSNRDLILFNEYEILPYDVLWEIILRYLK